MTSIVHMSAPANAGHDNYMIGLAKDTLRVAGLAFATLVFLDSCAGAAAHLIPRADFFGNPERAGVSVSPDGKRISFLAPLDGVLNIWVAPVSDLSHAKALTHDRNRGIRIYDWAQNSRFVVYEVDNTGAENLQLHSVDASTGADRPLAAVPGARAELIADSVKHPDEILIGLNDRDPRWHDVWRVNVVSGARSLVYRNESATQFVADSNLALRYAEIPKRDGGLTVRRFVAGNRLVDYLRIPPDDSLITNLVGFDTAGTTLYAISSVGRDKAALVSLDPMTARETVLGASDRADVSDTLVKPITAKVQAYAVEYLTREWIALDPAIKGDLALIASHTNGGTWSVESRSNDDRIWIVSDFPATEAPYYAVYDRARHSFARLFAIYPRLAGQRLAPMYALVIKARDGLDLTAYLTLPPDDDVGGRPASPLPMVLWVHGGPWGRDSFGFQQYHQLLANRGYAVMSVNFRSSSGFGKRFIAAGDRQWGRAMEDDLIDAKNWAIRNRISQAGRVAIVGNSYGGYATLAALSMRPNEFACGVDSFGPANLQSFLATVPPYWQSEYTLFTRAIGDPATRGGRDLLKERSPLTYVAQIARPLLVAQGANDARVNEKESDAIVKAMQAHHLPVTYLLYGDEGHGFLRPEDKLSYVAISEAFLSKCLGGRAEPIGDDLKGAKMQILTGAGNIPGLADALVRSSTDSIAQPH
jgi:dipeptidyl aminopeptidase/acylaminoacyl peptidase